MTTPAVLHLISSLNVGGAERLLVSTMQAAAQAGGQRFVICVMNLGVDAGLMADLVATGFPVVHLKRAEGHLSPRYIRAILRLIDAHGIDIIHTHNRGSRTWGMLAKLMRPRLKLVYTVHAEGIGSEITGLNRYAYHRLIDASIAISRHVARECAEFGARTVQVIENGVPLAMFRRPQRQGAWSKPLRLINVARFAPIKGQDILIEALARCRARGLDAHLTLVGIRSDQTFYESLLDQVRRLGLEDHVRFVLDRTDFVPFLHEADLFVLPSRAEGFGLVLIEAMAAELPVIAAHTGGAAELVESGRNGLTFEKENPAALTEAILALAGDRLTADRYVAAGLATAARYDISETLVQHLRLYRGLAQGRAPAQTRSEASGAQGAEINRRSEMPSSVNPRA